MARFNFKNRKPTNAAAKNVKSTSSKKNYAPKSNVTPKVNKTPKTSGDNKNKSIGGGKLPPVTKSTIKKEEQQFCCAPCYDQVRGKINPKSCSGSKEKYVSSKYNPPLGTILPTREGKNGVFFYKDSKGNEKQCSFGSTPVGCTRKVTTRPTLKKEDKTTDLDGITVVKKKVTVKDPKEVVSKTSETIFNANKLTESEKETKKSTLSKSSFTPKQTEEVKQKQDKANTGGQSPIIFNPKISGGGGPSSGRGFKDNVKTVEETVDGNLPSLGGTSKGGTFVKGSDSSKFTGTKAGLEESKAEADKKKKISARQKAAEKRARLEKDKRKAIKKEEPRSKVLKDYKEKNTGKGTIITKSLPLSGGGPGGRGSGNIGSPITPIDITPIQREEVEERKRCSDRKALNYDEFCNSDTECCVYESSLRDPIVCSDSKQSNLRIKMDSIDSQIKVLEGRKVEIESQSEFIPIVEDDTPSGTNYSNLTSNNVTYTTLPSIEKFTKDGVYVRSTVLSIEGNTNQSTESKGNPDYSDSTKWNAYVEEKLGSVYFKLNVDGNEDAFRIDNHSQGDDADFYREFCLAKGYEYDYFVKTNGKLKYSNKGLKGASIYCVDTEFIVTDDVADVKMVFASSQWDGFLLPKSDNGEVKITMDVMVKFDADVIIDSCLAESEVPYIDLNTQYDTTNCNIVVFTDEIKNKEVFRQTKKSAQIIDSETKQVNWVYDDGDEDIWNRSGLQVEPKQEFCDRVGAKLYNSNNLFSKQERKYYDDSEYNRLYSINEEYAGYRDTLKNDIEDYSILVDELNSGGYSVKGYEYAQSNYYELINTQNVCKVDTPLLNEGYTTMTQEYGVMIKQLYDLDNELDFCVARYEILTKEINVLNTEKKNFGALLEEKREENAKKKNELRTLDVTYSETKKNNDELINGTRNNTDRSRYQIKASEDQALYEKQRKDLEIAVRNLELDIKDIRDCLDKLDIQINSVEEQREKSENCKSLREGLISVLDLLILNNDSLTKKTKSLYDSWGTAIEATYRAYLGKTLENVDDYLEGTNIDLSLEVDNSVGTLVTDKVYKYTKLWSYSKEDIWRFDKTKAYSGILLSGSEANVNLIKRNVGGAETLFNPLWQRLTLTLSREECEQLRLCYPDKQFFIGLGINNPKNCQTTLLVDNIQVDTEANFVKRLYSTTLPPSFNLTPVIDDRKSWVYSDGGVVTADTKTIFTKPQERSESGMEYRYTDYTANHSKLVINSKETTFRIDPSNAVECDVYGFWQEIDCDTCDTTYSCTTATTLNYTNPTGGTIGLTGTVVTSSFDCNDISNQLKTNNDTWRTNVYNSTGSKDLAKSISFTNVKESQNKPKSRQKVSNSSYVNKVAKNNGVFDSGVSSYTPKKLNSGFDTQTNQCNTSIIEIKNDDNTYILIGEETNGSLGFYKYSADTNVVSEVTSFIDEQCCLRVSRLINDEFKLSKPNYQWSGTECIWNESASITDSCDSDCSYYGTEKTKTDFVTTGTSLSATCSDTPVCIKPLEYLDKAPNAVNIKPQFDEMVIANLIDAKSRQVISGYPMLQLFYNQYMEANGCGASLTNRLGTETVFDVMDLIGDYWTDVIEQVIPSTTIWDGIKNSGKLYRNTIFEQTKFPYTRYAINYDTQECEISKVTDYSVGVNTGSTIELTSKCIQGNCLGDDMIGCNAERKVLIAEKKRLEDQIETLKGILSQTEGNTTAAEEISKSGENDRVVPNREKNDDILDGIVVKDKKDPNSGFVDNEQYVDKNKEKEEEEGNKVIEFCNNKKAENYKRPCQRTGPCCKMKVSGSGKTDTKKPNTSVVQICTDNKATNYNRPCNSQKNCCIYTSAKDLMLGKDDKDIKIEDSSNSATKGRDFNNGAKTTDNIDVDSTKTKGQYGKETTTESVQKTDTVDYGDGKTTLDIDTDKSTNKKDNFSSPDYGKGNKGKSTSSFTKGLSGGASNNTLSGGLG
jgi:hypothetical protein